jgi:site-specific recombinase XerD
MLTVKTESGTVEPMAESASGDTSALTLAIAGFLDACRSTNTRAAYHADLSHFAGWCTNNDKLNLLTADAADIARYRTACELDGAHPATVARRLSAIVSFSNYAAQHGLEPVIAPDSNIERPPLAPASTSSALSDADAYALLSAADRTSARVALLIRLLMLDGLKVGEVTRADVCDVHGRPPRITLDIKARTPPTRVLHPETSSAVRRYLGRRRDGPLLLSEKRGQPNDRLTRFGIDYLIKQTAQAAGLEGAISANTLRRRYAIAAHANGTDLNTIRHNMGHAAQHTTRRYLDTEPATESQQPRTVDRA